MIKVLVVDDDKLVRKGLISAMPWQEFHMQVVGEANNGEKALEFLEAHKVDLLLTDLAMPVMSGIELMRVVRTRFPSIHIVILTLHQDFEYVQEALRLGAIDYIAKVQLEKERFEEVLERIYKRIEQQPKPLPADYQEPETYTVAKGFAVLSLSNGLSGDWIKQVELDAKESMTEIDHNLWLWIPLQHEYPAGTAANAGLEQLMEKMESQSDWAIIELDGINGLSPKEVHRCLREYKEKEFFYDYDPENRKGVLSIREWENLQPASRSEDGLNLLKEQWSSHEWIHHDSPFKKLVDELKLLKLPQAKLIGLLYSLTDEWNRLFHPLGTEKFELAGSLDCWYQVEAWLYSVRHTVRQAMNKPSYSQEVTESVMRAVTLIHEEINSQVTAAEIARRVNMSRSYFSQCFKDILGKTFNDYLRHARIEKAKEYLLYTNKTISWIAEHTGYMDEKYFSRTFREQTGILPSEYRQAGKAGRELSGN
ncbi:MAG: response regulator [Paenibacillus sp.]|jgi:two-component system response regulator YesN|nr:response regulator [Paenibacillus sp.]